MIQKCKKINNKIHKIFVNHKHFVIAFNLWTMLILKKYNKNN